MRTTMPAETNFPAIQYAKASDDVKVAYFTVGSGRPVVFASNIFGDVHLYRRGWPHVHDITGRLAGLGWRVIRHDHRGMGYSDRNVLNLSLEARVDDVHAVVSQVALKRFALVGVSLGAATAIAYAVRHPALISHLVLISPFVSGARLFEIADLRVATSTAVTGDREWKVFANMLGSAATAFEDPQLGRQIASAIQESTDPKGFAAYNEATQIMDLTEFLLQIAMPCLVIHEPGFPFGSFELCQQVASRIPNAQFVIVGGKSIAGSMHDGHVTAIDQFLRSGTVTQSISVASGSPAGVPRFIAPDGLTPREVEVLTRVAAGMTNKEIAAELSVAIPTIERHLVNVYIKIGARGRADATAYAVRHGLDAPPL
jgi:pimeloyl-ACP methyl ester carboxylesterase/DNA-binding CsgD family transcriptional regulator